MLINILVTYLYYLFNIYNIHFYLIYFTIIEEISNYYRFIFLSKNSKPTDLCFDKVVK